MRYWSFAAMLAAVAASGCHSDTYPVSGTVTFEDQSPVKDARVVFRSTFNGEFISAFATTDENGEYALTTWQTDDGAVAGEHVVVVTKPQQVIETEEGKAELLPPEIDEKYADYKTTPLKFTVKEDDNVINIEVGRVK